MSPYLFVLCMEKVALLIQEKVHEHKVGPTDFGGKLVEVLLYGKSDSKEMP